MTRDAVTRALTDEVLKYAVSEYLRLNQLAVWAGTGRNEGAALVRRLLLDALSRAGLLAASPPGAREDAKVSAAEVLAVWDRWRLSLETGSFSHYDGVRFVKMIEDLFDWQQLPKAREERPTPPAERGTHAAVLGKAQELREELRHPKPLATYSDLRKFALYCVNDIIVALSQAHAARPAEPPQETPAPVIERGWALRRKDTTSDYRYWNHRCGHDVVSQATLYGSREVAERQVSASANWEPVYVTRSVTVSVSPDKEQP